VIRNSLSYIRIVAYRIHVCELQAIVQWQQCLFRNGRKHMGMGPPPRHYATECEIRYKKFTEKLNDMKWRQHDPGPDPSLRSVCTEDKRFFLFRLTSWLWIIAEYATAIRWTCNQMSPVST